MAFALKRIHSLTRAAAAAVVAALVVAGGCDDGDVAQNPAPPRKRAAAVATPKSQPVGAAPETAPAPAEPAHAFLTIDGAATEFPPARLRLTRTHEGARALLFTDDPRSASSAGYKGNSFYFEVPLKLADPKDVNGAEYWYKAPVSDAEGDLPYGIFLGGIRGTHLQPQDLALRFEGEGDAVMVRVVGRFLVVNQDGKAAPDRFAGVTGTLFTTVENDD